MEVSELHPSRKKALLGKRPQPRFLGAARHRKNDRNKTKMAEKGASRRLTHNARMARTTKKTGVYCRKRKASLTPMKRDILTGSSRRLIGDLSI